MACRAIGGYPFRLVATDAKLHFNRDMGLRKRKGHSVHIAVAVLAGDFSEGNVPPVRKIGMVGDPVYLNPWDQPVIFDEANQFLLFLAVRHRFLVAVPAVPDIGDGSFLMGLCLDVTVEAAKSHFFYMLVVIVCNWLGNAFLVGTTANKEDTEKKEEWDDDSFPVSHRASASSELPVSSLVKKPFRDRGFPGDAVLYLFGGAFVKSHFGAYDCRG